MKKALLIASVLFIAVISTACINNIAVQELNNKAAEYMQKGDYEAAVNRLQASIDLDSSMYETYYNLGIAATKAKKYEVAVDALQQGIKINPDHVDFYYSLAVAQAEWASSIEEDEEEDEKQKLSQEEVAQIQSLRESAILNAEKYLSSASQIEDKEEIEQFIKELQETEKEEQPVLLKG